MNLKQKYFRNKYKDDVKNPQKLQFQKILNTEKIKVFKRYESTDAGRRSLLQNSPGNLYFTSSDTHQENGDFF